MTKEEERKYRNALALAKDAEEKYKFLARGGLPQKVWNNGVMGNVYKQDIGGQGGSVRGRNIRGLLDNQATTGLIEAATEAKQAAMTPTNQAIMLEKDRTWKDKLAGRKSIQGQYWEAYPESAPRNLWDEFVYRNMTTGWGSVPEKNMKKAGIWALENLKEQEAARNSQPNWSPAVGPNYNPTIESSPIVPPGVTYTAPKNLSDAEAAAIYSQPVMTNDEIAEHGVGNTGFLNKNAKYGYMDLGEMMGRLRYNPDGTFSRLPTMGTGWGDAAADALRAAGQHSIIPYIGMEKLGGGKIYGPGDWAADQLNRIEADREYNLPENVALRKVAAEREAEVKRQRMMADAMSSYKPRPTPPLVGESEYSLPQRTSLLGPELEPYVENIFEGGPVTPEQKMFAGYNPDIKAQMDAQRVKNEELRLANLQADEEWRVEEAGELYSEITGSKITADSLLDGITEAMNDTSNDEWAAEKAAAIRAWLDEQNKKTSLGTIIKDKVTSWGSIAVDYMMGLGENDNDGLEENEVKEVIEVVEDLAKQS